jgi:hypothetical protein
MAKVFFPEKSTFVVASPPHPNNTQYRVSIGLETWGGENHRVVKVQMVYDGEVAGRRSPSYPVGSDDYARVQDAIRELVTTSRLIPFKPFRE